MKATVVKSIVVGKHSIFQVLRSSASYVVNSDSWWEAERLPGIRYLLKLQVYRLLKLTGSCLKSPVYKNVNFHFDRILVALKATVANSDSWLILMWRRCRTHVRKRRAAVDNLNYHVHPILSKKPKHIIIHLGKNDATCSRSRQILE